MAELHFKAHGKRWPELARRVAAENPGAELIETPEGLTVKAPYLTVTKRMVLEICFPKGTEHPGTAMRLLTGLALLRQGRLVAHTDDRIVIGDDDGERAMTVRFRIDHQQTIARLATDLKMSRNEFVVRAVEHFADYLDASRELPALD